MSTPERRAKRKTPAPCGTYAGLQAHQRRREPACEACRKAGAEYAREYRESREGARRLEKLRIKARGRALSQLADAHPEQYKSLYEAAVAEIPEIEQIHQQMKRTRKGRGRE